MAQFEETGPAKPVTESIRVDKVSPRARRPGDGHGRLDPHFCDGHDRL
jgi:hypothetical protein